MKRRTDASREKADKVAGVSRASGLIVDVPSLVEFIVDDKWEDGKTRETGTVLLCFGEGRWKAWLHDKDGRQSVWVSAGSLQGVLEALEAGLVDCVLDWRQDRGTGPKGR